MNLFLALFFVVVQNGMVAIPSGPFERGCQLGIDCPLSYHSDSPRQTIYLSTFYIDRYEATAEEFAAFLEDQGEGPPYVQGVSTGHYWLPFTYLPTAPSYGTIERTDVAGVIFHYNAKPGYERYPANLVSFFGAEAYCAWKGKRLPTEAEWEKAARGTDYRKYPWGSEDNDGLRARHMQDLSNLSPDTLMPVDALPAGASAYGVMNMGGNVWDWVSDWYSPTYYQVAPYSDPKGPAAAATTPPLKILRGGSAVSQSWVELTTMWRTPHEPWQTSSAMGVRCAWSP